MVIYIISDEKKGHLSQTRGLAEALLERAMQKAPNAPIPFMRFPSSAKIGFQDFSIKEKTWICRVPISFFAPVTAPI